MAEHLLTGLAMALACIAIHYMMQPEMILERIGNRIRKMKYLAKPLGECPLCMCAWWGSLLWLLTAPIHGLPFIYLPLDILLAMGLTVPLNR